MARDHLFGIRLKLSRAQQQTEALKRDIDAFMTGNPYGVTAQFSSERRALSLIAQIRKPCDPMWGVQIGEIAHNLRSALDHLVWELVIHNTGAPPVKPKQSQFPIYAVLEGPGGYAENYGRWLAGVSDEARTLIQSAQPFATGEGTKSPLWRLHELSNFDKHRTLHLTRSLLDAGELKFSGLAPSTPYEARIRLGQFKHNAAFLTLTFGGDKPPLAGPAEKVRVKGPMTFGIAFDEGSPLAEEPVIPMLRVVTTGTVEFVQQCAEEIFRV